VSDVVSPGSVSAAAVAYVQRSGIDPLAGLESASVLSAPPDARRLLHVQGLGGLRRTGGSAFAAEKLLTGLAGARSPIAAIVHGTGNETSFHIGAWNAEGESADRLQLRERVLRSVLDGVYPSIEIAESTFQPSAWPLAGLALGVPTVTPPDPADGSNGADRLVAAMTGMRFVAVVLAVPLSEEYLASRSGHVLNELRAVAAWEQASRAPSPLGRHYSGLLEHALATLSVAQGVGGWRTAVYLMGDEVSYPCLASSWRAIHSGSASLPEPIRVFDAPDASGLAARWALPEVASAPGPAGYEHDFGCQSVISSRHLAGLIQLPARELPGFSIRVAPAFDVVPAVTDAASGLALGDILYRSRRTEAPYRITPKSLTRHAFVAGVTGSGKTNTIFHILAELDERGIPFLAIEPAKREYRELANEPRFAGRLQIFTPGDESVAPLRLNPFEVPAGTAVQEHLDLLRAAFSATFGMWAPLPQVLERSMHEIYADRGWDLRTNQNPRLGNATSAAAFPTLSDLTAKVAEVATSLGYEERVTADIRAALVTRLDALRHGGKGAMLDVAQSIPIERLLDRPTVLELEPVGDDDDKAFLMALLLARLGEYRRAQGKAPDLLHVLVIEEAHRLLANVGTQVTEFAGNPRGEAVETFTNLLSEIRAYGQGVIVADQVPSRLAPDVIKNTNLKVAHRIVAADDRAVLGASMVMDTDQMTALATMGPGQAAVYSDGDDAPLLVAIPLVKNAEGTPPTNADIARAAGAMAFGGLPSPACVDACATDRRACDWAREVTSDRAVQKSLSRLVVSTAAEPSALRRGWPELLSILRPRWAAGVADGALLASFAGHAADWWGQRRGAQEGWMYADVAKAVESLRNALLAAATQDDAGSAAAEQAFHQEASRLLTREVDPFPRCSLVCGPSACIYRRGVADLVAAGNHDAAFRTAENADTGDTEARGAAAWRVAQDGGYEVTEFAESDLPPELVATVDASARRASLCFAQQMITRDSDRLPRSSGRAIERILAASGHVQSGRDNDETASP
jgi:DNA helicase HerA-like ATPase